MSTGFVCDERYFWWDARSAGLFMPSHVDNVRRAVRAHRVARVQAAHAQPDRGQRPAQAADADRAALRDRRGDRARPLAGAHRPHARAVRGRRRRRGRADAVRGRRLRDRAAGGGRHAGGDRGRARRHGRQRLRAGAAAGPPRREGSRPRLLHVRQLRDRRRPRAAGARALAGGDRRLGRAPRQRLAVAVLRRPVGADDLAAPGPQLPARLRLRERERHGRRRGRERQRAAAAGLGHGRLQSPPSSAWWRRRCAASSRSCSSSPRASTPRSTTRWRGR